jgi:hypothetical protein
MGFKDGGAFPASITPMPQKVAQPTNYINFQNDSGTGSGAGKAEFTQWLQQYLPELYESEVERYGNRTLSGFLRMVGAEMPMTSDQVIWVEQNRLHIAYDGVTSDQDDKLTIAPGENNAVRADQTIVVSDGFNTVKCLVKSSSGQDIIALPYTANDLSGLGATVKLFVYGSEFAKGTTGMVGSISPVPQTYNNSPIIMKDKFEVSGSDAAQIGWIEIATEDGSNGYLWYLKAESETRLRFEDYLEMMSVEGELAAAGSAALDDMGATGGFTSAVKPKGTQGLFAAIEARGNVWNNFAGAAAPGAGALSDFDAILKQLDKQGAIEENMLFLNRATALDFDDMLASISGGFAGGTAFGLFENSEEMALNLGFSGFRRGSYDFYKTDWKYLNDASTRGAIAGPASIEGVLVPAGTSTVYDQILGTNIRRPFLHVRYRASQADDRRMKSWLTGSVGGAFTSSLDAMEVNFLSERCLVTQAANNFVLFKGI